MQIVFFVFKQEEDTQLDHILPLIKLCKHSIIYFKISPWSHWAHIYSDDFHVINHTVASMSNIMLSLCPNLTAIIIITDTSSQRLNINFFLKIDFNNVWKYIQKNNAK